MSSLDKDLNEKFGKLSRSLRDERVVKGSYWDLERGQRKYDWYKQQKDSDGFMIEPPKANPDVSEDTSSPYNGHTDSNTQNVFDELIEKMKFLTTREKEVIQLLWEGKVDSEIAVILGIDRRNVATLLSRARKKIKKLYGKRTT